MASISTDDITITGTASDDIIIPFDAASGADNIIDGGAGDDVIFGDHGTPLFDNVAVNNSVANAFSIDPAFRWSTFENPDIADTSIPYTTVLGSGAGARDFFKVTVGAGETITIDADWVNSSTGSGPTAFDGVVRLLNPDGTLVLSDDDSPATDGGLGSTLDLNGDPSRDPLLSVTVATAQTYIIEFGEFLTQNSTKVIQAGASYVLNVSVTGHLASDTPLEGNDSITGGAGDDVIYGVAGDNTLEGGTGDDTVIGGAGIDTIRGGDDDDTVVASTGADSLDGGAGIDTLDLSGLADSVWFDMNNDEVYIGPNAPSGVGLRQDALNFEKVIGSDNADLLEGNNSINTISGGLGDDTLRDSTGGDTLLGEAGADTFTLTGGGTRADGGEGDDVYEVENGGNSIIGGAGMDTVFYNSSGQNTAGNTIDLGEDDDTILFAESSVVGTLEGGAGIDTLDVFALGNASQVRRIALDGSNPLFLDGVATVSGFENITGSFASEEFTGNDDANILLGEARRDILRGKGGNDSLNGGSGNDRLVGGTGNDTLTGGTGDDRLEGDDGDDRLDGGVGSDDLLGGAGTDRALYTNSIAGLTVDLQIAANNTGEAAGDTFSSIEDVFGSDFVDNMRGDGGANFIVGRGGNDILSGRDGDDILNGGGNDDLMIGGAGNDTMVGGSGNDIMRGGEGVDVHNGGAGIDRASYIDVTTGGVTVDLENAMANTGAAIGDTYLSVENLRGTTLIDNLRGDSRNNLLDGQDGNDVLRGRDGIDLLVGGNGNDVLIGGNALDRLVGGAGNDRFQFDLPTEGVDRVIDFAVGVDTIALNDLGFTALSTGALSAANFRAGSVALDADDFVLYNSANGRLFYDADGNGMGASQLVAILINNATLDENDIIVI